LIDFLLAFISLALYFMRKIALPGFSKCETL
jgi:hypothetical protein